MLGTTLATIPATVPYLRGEPANVEQWRQRLTPHQDKLKVGLVWAGSPKHRNDRNRSVAVSKLSPLGKVPGRVSSVSRKAPSPSPGTPGEGRGEGLIPLLDWTSELNDLTDTAGLIENLDLVITIDTAVAHLAGAMGKPVWVLLPSCRIGGGCFGTKIPRGIRRCVSFVAGHWRLGYTDWTRRRGIADPVQRTILMPPPTLQQTLDQDLATLPGGACG